jgi:hypothetical protein
MAPALTGYKSASGGSNMNAAKVGALGKVAVWGFCLFAAGLSKSDGFEAERLASPPLATPVVVFGPDARATIEDFAIRRRLDPTALRRRYSGTGVVHCGAAHGSGQLTVADDVITTAAHVFYDRNGALRADSAHCRFVIDTGGQEISTAIEVKSLIAGSTNPYNQDAVNDWAVARLARPVREAEPYPLAPQGRESTRTPVLFVARGAIDWQAGRQASMQDCRLRDALESGAEGTREFSFDCAAGIGASGSGLFDRDGGGLMAVFVGFRSVAPDQPLPFSAQHYNFAVTVEGAFRRAVELQAALEATAAK